MVAIYGLVFAIGLEFFTMQKSHGNFEVDASRLSVKDQQWGGYGKGKEKGKGRSYPLSFFGKKTESF